MKRPEILAPAGNIEAFSAAIHAGADAIYVGLKVFNARAYAQNFTPDELRGLRQRSAQEGVKLYATLNAVVKEGELKELIKTLCELDQIGVDAVIIQDLGTLRLVKRYFPSLRPHASTLMTIHNSLGIKAARALGFKRVVIAREMTLNEIRQCAKDAPIELECFVFGAMCFTYSGLCLMSSLFGGKASTRGRCVQPCRRLYEKRGKGLKKGAYFSMLDLDALELLHPLGEAGIRSFKIEGRLRPAHYVYHAVRAVRCVLDAPQGDDRALKEAKKLAQFALGRQSSTGFFLIDQKGSPPPIQPSAPPNTGRYLGKILSISGNSCIIESELELSVGDRLRFLSSDGSAQLVKKIQGFKRGQDNIWTIEGLRLPSNYVGGRTFLTDRKGRPFRVEKFHHIPLDGKRLRQCIRKIESKALAWHGPRPKTRNKRGEANIWVRVYSPRDVEALMALKDVKGFYLWLNPTLAHKSPPHFKCPITWFIPPILYEDQISYYEQAVSRLIKMGYRSFQVSNIGALSIFEGKKSGVKLSCSYHLNVMNSLAIEQLRDLGVSSVEISLELDKKSVVEILERAHKVPIDMVVYGYIPLFTSRLSSHPWLRPGDELKSPKGEEFFWHPREGVGHLIFKHPFSILGSRNQLRQLPMRRWVIDLSFGPPGWVFKRKGGGKSIFFGLKGARRRLNFESTLF